MVDTWLKSAIGISVCPLAISTPTIVINAKGVSSTTQYGNENCTGLAQIVDQL
jgi:hypothetical protein